MSRFRLYSTMDMMLEFCNRGIKNCDLLESAIIHEGSLGSDVDKTDVLEKNVVAAINTKLERAESHLQGLNLLYQFLPRISRDSLISNFPRWISKVTQILNNAHASSIEIVCQTTGALVAKCKKIPELDKSVSINNVKHIIKILVQRYDEENDGALLNLLTVLLYHYPEACARLQGHYNKIITAGIDEVNDDTIITGAKCYTLLVRALERSFSSKNEAIIFPDNVPASCHVSHQIDLCHNLCILLDELFQDLVSVCVEFPNSTLKNTKIINLELNELSRLDLFDYYRAAQNRFTNICIYLSTLLKIGGNGRKKYALPNIILQVICKGLAITPANLQRSDDDGDRRKDFLISILPAFHVSLLNVLGDLINSFQQELLPFALTIQRLIVQTLEWTQRYYKRFKDIRILTYKTLTIWLKQAGTLSGFQLVADEFLPHILKDLSPPSKKTVVLSANVNKGTKRKSKTQNSKGTQTASDVDSEISLYSDMDLCSQVLSTTQAIVSNANIFLKQSFYIEIRNAIATSLCERYAKKESFPGSLENTEYRLQLLKALQVLNLFTHVSTPPPTAIAIKIFGEAMQEDDPDIREEAKLGFAMLHHIIYPSAPSLMPPVYEPQASSRPSSPMEVVQHENIILPSRMKRCHQEPKDDVDDSPEAPKRQKASEQESTDATYLTSRMKRCHQEPKDDVNDSLEAPKRQKASEEESTDATFVPVKHPSEQSALENEISKDIEISAPIKSQITAGVTVEIPVNGNSNEPPASTDNSCLKATNDKNETDDDMLLSFCDEPIS